MPEGPLGFPRLTELGPFVEDDTFTVGQEQVSISEWPDCNSPDSLEEELCKTIKEETLRLMQEVDTLVDELEDVNHGYCYWIADNVYVEMGAPDEIDVVEKHSPMGTNHAYLRYNNKFYDAEVPHGVDNLTDLPFVIRYPNVSIDKPTLIFIRSEGESGMGLTDIMKEELNNA